MPPYTQRTTYNKVYIPEALPCPDVDNLLQFAGFLPDAKQRDHIDMLVVVIRDKGYVGKLLNIFGSCEEQNDLSNMRTLRGIFNTLLLWSNTDMIKELVDERYISGVLAVFELASRKSPSYREMLGDLPRIDLSDLPELQRKKIRQMEHLEFFKSQIASLFRQKSQLVNALNQLIWWVHIDMVNWIQQDDRFKQKLFEKIGDQENVERHSALNFLYQVFTYASNDMQDFAGASFLRILADKNLFDIIQPLLYDSNKDIHDIAVNIVYTASQLDLVVVQHHIALQAEADKQKADLLQAILEQLTNDSHYESKQRLFQLIKLILGLVSSHQYHHHFSTFTPQALFGDDRNTGNMLKLFYERHAILLLGPIHSIPIKPVDMTSPLEPMTLDNDHILFYDGLCEFLQTMILQYGGRMKRILYDRKCFLHLVQLLRCQDPQLRLRTVRFFRATIGLRDTEINGLLVDQNVFATMIRLLLDTNPQQNNALYAGLLELFDYIQDRNISKLIEHIVSDFGGFIEPILTLPAFKMLKLKYEKHIEAKSTFSTSSFVF